MSYKIIITILILIPKCLLGQTKAGTDKDWVINEIYVSESPTRHGLFLELYNSSSTKVPFDLFLSADRNNPNQFKLKTKSHYNPDLRKHGYRTFRISVLRLKRRTIKIYNKPDSLYLFRRMGYEFQLKDVFPILWNDSLSIGRCDNRICYFNIPTPGRVNKNVDPSQYTPRKNYRVSILGGVSAANNTGFGNGVGRTPSYGIKLQKVVNRRLFYTATSAALFQQGYSFKSTETSTTTTGQLTRTVKGHYTAFEFWAGKDIGIFLTPRIDISCGAALVLASLARQVYDESIVFVPLNGTTSQGDTKQKQKIGNYSLPVLTFNAGFNYQLTSNLKIEFFHNILFRTFERNVTTYYHSFNIGISTSFRRKGRGYREGLLW